MTRIIPIYKATDIDLPDSCAICGRPLRIGDDIMDIYGDLYHAKCMETVPVEEESIDRCPVCDKLLCDGDEVIYEDKFVYHLSCWDSLTEIGEPSDYKEFTSAVDMLEEYTHEEA